MQAAPAIPRFGRRTRLRLVSLTPTDWQPACMSGEEYAGLLRFVSGFPGVHGTRPPCYECPVTWAAEQRAQGHCNGKPRGG